MSIEATVAEKESQVTLELGRLENANISLTAVIDRLFDRLSRVLTQEPPSVSDETKKEVGVPLANDISDQADSIINNTDRLKNLTQRLEV